MVVWLDGLICAVQKDCTVLTKYHNNDPNLRNLLSGDRNVNKMMLATLWKKKKKKKKMSKALPVIVLDDFPNSLNGSSVLVGLVRVHVVKRAGLVGVAVGGCEVDRHCEVHLHSVHAASQSKADS